MLIDIIDPENWSKKKKKERKNMGIIYEKVEAICVFRRRIDDTMININ